MSYHKFLFFAFFLFIYGVNAQTPSCDTGGCSTFNNQYPLNTFSTTSTSWVTVSAYMNAGNYTLFNVVQGNTYEWTYSSCAANGYALQNWDAQITLYDYNNWATPLCFQDDANNAPSNCWAAPYMSWTATFTGTVMLLTSAWVSGSGCQTNTNAPYSKLAWRMSAQNSCSGWGTNPSFSQFSSGGGNSSFSVYTSTGGCGFSASSNNNWINNISYPGGGVVNYNVDANTSTSSRAGYIDVLDANSNVKTTVTINQDGLSCNYNISPTSNSLSSSGGTGSVQVTASSGCTWTASSNQTWATITSGSNGSGNGSVNYSVSANTGTNTRYATITVSGQSFNITQAGLSCTYSLSPTSSNLSNAASNSSFQVITQNACVWTASSNQTWATITSGGNGTGNGSVNYSVSANTGTNARYATITVSGQSFNITQAGLTCTYSLSPTSSSLSSAASNGSFQVTTQTGCVWTASSNQTWATITSGSNGTGSGSVNYSVSANTGTNPRYATITVAGQNFDITQAPGQGTQTYAISANSNPVNGGSTNGGGTFTLGVSITLTATPNTGWSFVNWTENGATVSTNNSYTFNVSGDRNLVANFTQASQTANITGIANPANAGVIYGSGNYLSGLTANLIAVPNGGWSFLNWTDNSTNPIIIVSTNPSYSFTVTGTKTFVANFIPNVSIENAHEFQKIQLYPNPTSEEFTLEFEEILNDNIKVEVVDILGKSIFLEEIIAGKKQYLFSLKGRDRGIYFIKISLKEGIATYKLILE